MSDLMKIEFRYAVPYTLDSIEAVLRALAEAVETNWRDRDAWCDPRPDLPVEIAAWTSLCGPDSLAWDDISKQWRPRARAAPEWKFTEFFFNFSPLSSKAMSANLVKERDGSVTIRCLIYASVRNELLGDRRVERMVKEWDRIRLERGEPEPREHGPDEDHPGYDAWWDELSQLDYTFSAWPQARRHLRRIIKFLRAALPLRDAWIDPRLREEDIPPVTDERLRGRRDLFQG